ncbi:hypothetical protein Purlil1_7661 [Purpureocillium lilacinum]|uniref:RRM domain-containing protein n=2 Tax=Purpureocillium lilacinum TaxID=33203 RepID=A0ABR0BWU6_PURLI|nr:hypothetical protein Purlil1_7661 [Purpureocillium lilacinum]
MAAMVDPVLPPRQHAPPHFSHLERQLRHRTQLQRQPPPALAASFASSDHMPLHPDIDLYLCRRYQPAVVRSPPFASARPCDARLRRSHAITTMASPVGEQNWLAYLEEAARTAVDLEQRVNVVELYKRAIGAEPGSLRLWLAYCNYFWSLWASSHAADASDSTWSDEEQLMGREIFSFGAALDLWQQGYEAIKYRINDSNQFWDRWVSLEMEQLAKTKTPEGVRRITHLYRDRLAIPHLTWDETSQAFSSFLSQYNKAAWEETMKEVTSAAQGVKRVIDARDPFELKLQAAARQGDAEAEKAAMRDYLEWEILQSKRNNDVPEMAVDICSGLFSRALTGIFSSDDGIWHEHVVFVSSNSDAPATDKLLDILRRAVVHCPWSGQLWNRFILCAEEAKLPFSEIEAIKHAATSDNQLYRDGMESVIEMYVAWCGFLKRTALEPTATDESVDVADVGLRAALEDVDVVGKRLYGKEFQGDPKFRLERIYIQYLTERKGAIDEARGVWNKLKRAQVHADSYDFWFRYYMWEMLIFSSHPQSNRSPTPSSSGSGLRTPQLATAVLHAAATRRSIDWPEKVFEVYLQHCNDYELPASVRRATDMVHKAEKAVRRRRLREEEEKAAAYAAYYGTQPVEEAVAETESPSGSKRKREANAEAAEEDETVTKRQRGVNDAADASQATPQEGVKRDRENSTVLVTGLPADVTQTKVRQYFKEYGHINHITALVQEKDGQSSTSLIEFRSPDDAQSALLRDGKYMGQSQLSVESGHDLTVYVANYPPAADEKYMRELFKDCGEMLSIRWPSLKVNTHRRFCYISFRDRDASAKAVAKEGTMLDDKYRLLSKYSDPGRKKNREGAVAEGREVHISNLDKALSEQDIRQAFSQYGTILRVNIPMTLAGKNRGFAYLDYETKEQAEKAVEEMNNTKFRSQILSVALSKESKVKHASTIVNASRESASPAPSRDHEGDEAMSESGVPDQSKPSAEDIAARTIALMGLPDTVNDTRVRALIEPHGEIVKLVLQPAHGGAKIEFVDAATAGKAALSLDGTDFEGNKLRTGSVEELRHAKAEHKADRIVYGNKDKSSSKPTNGPAPSAASGLMRPPAPVRRPVLGRPGPKRGLGFAPRRAPAASSTGKADGDTAAAEKPAPKSNADFKAMFLQSGDAKKGEAESEAKAPDGEKAADGNGA